MAMSPVALAQSKFLMNGGGYELALAKMRAAGTMPEFYIFHEYPKAIRISRGMGEPVERETETCKGTVIRWTEKAAEIFETFIVDSEEEEERILAGGMTSAQIEDERLGLINRCHSLSIPVDPGWSVVRLRRELGDALDAPPPGDEMGALRAQLAQLEEMAAMKAKIAALQAQIAGGSQAPQLEAPIEELGDTKRRKVPA
jgi:hypothetical protein